MEQRLLMINDDPEISELPNLTFQDERHNGIQFNTSKATGYSCEPKPALFIQNINSANSYKSGMAICTALKPAVDIQALPVILPFAQAAYKANSSFCSAGAYAQRLFNADELLLPVRTMLFSD